MKKLYLYLHYLLLLAFPFGLLFRIHIFKNVYLIPQDIVVCVIAALSIFFYSKEKIRLTDNKFLFFQLLFIAVGLISLFINFFVFRDIDLIVSLLYALRYLVYVLLVAGIYFIPRENLLERFINISLITFLIAGFIQFVYFNDLRSYGSYGWDIHLYRLFSTLYDPNYAGVLYAIILFFFLSRVIEEKFSNSYKELAASFYSGIALFVTYSRTAIVGLTVGLLTVGILKKKVYAIVGSFLIVTVSIALVSNPKIEGLNPFRSVSSYERIKSIKEAFHIIQKSPVIGSGFNAYRYAQVRYGTRNVIGASISNADAGTDNSYLFVLATSGVIGFILFILSYLYLIKDLFFNIKKVGVFPLAIVVSVLAVSLFLNVLFYTPILTVLYIMITHKNQIFGKNN